MSENILGLGTRLSERHTELLSSTVYKDEIDLFGDYEYLFSIFDKAEFKGPFVINKDDDPNKLTHNMLRDTCVISGSPDTVSDSILNLMTEIGDFGIILYAAHDWTDKNMMIKSMELFANEVMPRINRKLNARQASAG